MHKLLQCLLLFAALAVSAAMALAQTPEMLTFHVKTPDGIAIQNADVMVQSAQPSEVVSVRVQGRLQLQRRSLSFVTKTSADGQAQATKANLEHEFPSGKIVVTVRAAGYEPYKQNFDLADQKSLEIVLHPLPPQK
jgi:uncharacterized membrane protein